jgi:hypothetical protein
MTTDIYGSFEFRGWEVPIIGQANIIFDDRSFDYDGPRGSATHHDGSWEVEEIDDINIDGNVRDFVIGEFHRLGKTIHNRGFKKSVRRFVKLINAAIDKLDYDSFTESQRDVAIDDACSD